MTLRMNEFQKLLAPAAGVQPGDEDAAIPRWSGSIQFPALTADYTPASHPAQFQPLRAQGSGAVGENTLSFCNEFFKNV